MNKRFLILSLASMAGFLAIGDRYVISTLYKQLISNYDLSSYVVFSILFSSFYLGYTIFQMPGGRIAQRYGPSRIIGVSLISWSFLFFLLPLTKSFVLAVLIAFVMGLAQGPVFPSIIFLVRLFYEDRRYTRASGIVSAVADLSPAIIPFVSISFYFSRLGLPLPFSFFAIIGIITGAAIILMKSDYKGSSAKGNWRSFLERRYLIFGLSFFVYDYFFYMIFTWYPHFLSEKFSISANNPIYGTLPWIFMAMGSVIFGLFMDRLNRDALVSEVSYIIIAVSLIGMALSRSSLIFLLFTVIALLFLDGPLLASWRLSTRMAGHNSSSFVGGWMNFWGNLGGIAAPVIIASLDYTYGLSNTFLFTVSVPILGLVCWIVMSRWGTNEK